jgi:hypothetical protein
MFRLKSRVLACKFSKNMAVGKADALFYNNGYDCGCLWAFLFTFVTITKQY